MPEQVLLSWSGGKESAMALYELRRARSEVVALLTTITKGYDRISMHGVRRALLEKQAKSLGLPLHEVFIPQKCSNEEYEAEMGKAMAHFQDKGISSVVFGDVLLEDVRRYRERNLARLGMRGIFPLWGMDTAELARKFIALGFRAIVVCVDSKMLSGSFVGREFDEVFLSDLPSQVDPCGENGEFHTFVFDGPIFKRRVPFRVGKVVLRDSFYFCDLLPFTPAGTHTPA